MRIKKLNEFIKDILIMKLFNKIVICYKMFCKKLIKAFKKTELHEEDKITFFLCLLMQNFKNCIKLFYFSLQEKSIILIYFLLFKEILHILQQIFIKDLLFDIIKVSSDNQLFFIYFNEIY